VAFYAAVVMISQDGCLSIDRVMHIRADIRTSMTLNLWFSLDLQHS